MAEAGVLDEKSLLKDLKKGISNTLSKDHSSEMAEAVMGQKKEAGVLKSGIAAAGALGTGTAGFGGAKAMAVGGAAWKAGGWAMGQAITAIPAAFWIFLSIGLYFSDLIWGFDGTPYPIVLDRFQNITQAGNMTWIGIFILSMAVIIYLITKEEGNWKKGFESSFALAAILSAIIWLGEWNRGIIHVLFAVAIYFFLARPIAEKRGIPKSHVNNTFALLLFIDFFGFGIASYMMKITGLVGPIDITNRFLLPVWLIYVVFGLTNKMEKSKLTSIITFLIFVILALAWMGDIGVATGIYGVDSKTTEQFRDAATSYGKAYIQGKELLYTFSDSFMCLDNFAEPAKYDKCLFERQVARHPELNESAIKGSLDEHIKDITKVELVKSAQFPSTIQKQFNPRLPIDYLLEINSPRKIKIKLSCSFKQRGIETPGEIGPDLTKQRLAEGVEGVKTEPIFCSPNEDYVAGPNKIIFKAEIENIETYSWLTRLFIGPDVDESRINELKAIHELTDEGSESGKEFAAFTFNFGIPAKKGESVKAILNEAPIQLLEGVVENKQKGRVTKISSLTINLIEDISLPNDLRIRDACLKFFDYSGDQLKLKKEVELFDLNIEEGKKLTLIKGCYFNIDDKLRFPKQEGYEYHKREFSAVMEYNYEIKKEEFFKVESDISLAIT